jgi:hypothetical protein
VLALVLALALGGCASLPTTGPVTAGAPAAEPRAYRVAPVGPSDGAGPVDVVTGFLRAAVGAPDDFAAARSHLVADRQRGWRPGARTVVRAAGTPGFVLRQSGRQLPWDPTTDPDPAAGPVDVEITAAVVATVDAHGTYAPAAPGTVERVELRLVRESGQWRIGVLPDQLLIDEGDFRLSWRPRSLFFPDRAGAQLVPEVRWFADRASTPTTVVAELMRGPSPWLAPAVRPGWPGDVALASDTVPVQDGAAQVDLGASVLDADPRTRALLRSQLEATLLPLSTVSSVVVTARGGALDETPTATGPGTPEEGDRRVEVDVPVDPSPLVLAGGAPARWVRAGGRVEPVASLAPPAPEDGALEALAVRGRTVLGLAGGRTTLLRWTTAPGGRGTPAVPAVVLTAAPGSPLTPPSLDPRGWAWSTATTSDGTVTAVGPDGTAVAVQAPWLTGRTVLSLRASREGGRVLVGSQAPDGSDPRVDVAGLARDRDGAPVSLTVADGAPTPWLASLTAAVWVDHRTVAVLGVAVPGTAPAGAGAGGGQGLFLVTGGEVAPLGAPGAEAGSAPDGSAAAPPVLVGLAAGNDARSLLLEATGPEGPRTYQRAGARWAAVDELAGTTAPVFAG